MELILWLINELQVTRKQAEGAAGALLQLAQTRLPGEKFVTVADTIPAISDVIGKSPRFEVTEKPRLDESVSRVFGGLGGLRPLAGPFAKLGLEKTSIRPFAEALNRYLDERGNAAAVHLLQQVWR